MSDTSSKNLLVEIKLEKNIVNQLSLLEQIKDLPPLSILETAREYKGKLDSLLSDIAFISDNLNRINDEEAESAVNRKVNNIELNEGMVVESPQFKGLMERLGS